METKIKKAMVLAAGYGTRLKPLTDHTPKPLVPVAGRPMIEYALDKLRACGIHDVVINVSYLKDQLTAYTSQIRDLRIQISEEPEPLETGGGLKHAEPLLGADPFFTINSDILWEDGPTTGALERLSQAWDPAIMDVLLLAQPRARALGYDLGEDHLFIKPDNTLGWDAAEAPYIIAGVGIFHPRLLAGAPAGKFSVKVLWLQALERGRLFCLPHHGSWYQTGTLQDIRQAEAVLQAGVRP
jgi:MurNAc alpha-1-phosphate uridylyltransferase